MAPATRPEFGKNTKVLETLNKKNVLDRTMPELALVIGGVKGLATLAGSTSASGPSPRFTRHHVRVDRIKKGSVSDTKGKAVRFYIL